MHLMQVVASQMRDFGHFSPLLILVYFLLDPYSYIHIPTYIILYIYKDGNGRCKKTVRLGEDNHGKFWRIKKMFNFTNSKTQGKDTSKARRSSKIASSEDEFQNRLLFEIYKNMSSNRELSSA
jgi:hypothetical protein